MAARRRRARALQFAAVQVVGAVAVIHLVVGAEQLATIAANGLLGAYLTGRVIERPRALLFVASGLAALAGLVAAGRGRLARATAYRVGLALMAAYLVGWVAWHTVLDHGVALAGGARAGAAGTPHDHGGLAATLASHYLDPLVAVLAAAGSGTPGTGRTLLGVVAVTLELVALALLVALVRLDPPSDSGIEPGGPDDPNRRDRPDRGSGPE